MGVGGIFDTFAQATTFRQILQYFQHICLVHNIDPSDYRSLYSKLREVDKGCENSKAQKLFSLIDKRFNHPVYVNQEAAGKLDILIVGAGPCGLRAAIECALLGAHVVVIEQRDKFTRNNVLHLWQFVIQDLKALGAKIFFPKFCTGSIDHISIRQLQCILLKVALCLGVQVYDSVSFIDYKKPVIRADERVGGWTAVVEPRTHILSSYEFDILIGADGKRNTVKGFPKDCMRARLAIGITANFRNTHTAAEVNVPEISGVAFIFNQPFFSEMKTQTGVELENIVYYKDETHYFVMSAMKRSLLEKHVLKQDYDEVSLLLSKENIDQDMLCKFATQAADFATNKKLPLNYVTNGRGECDVAMFDFTAVYKAQHSVTVSESSGRFLFTTIVGDSLYEPFWPTGSGCARGFLGVFDSAWMIRELGLNRRPLIEVVAERERIYKLLANANKDNMKTAFSKYTIDPTTRYTSLELSSVAEKVLCHLDFENMDSLNDGDVLNYKNKLPSYMSHSPITEKLSVWSFCNWAIAPKFRVINFSAQSWGDAFSLAALLARFRKDLVDFADVCKDSNSNNMLIAMLKAIESEYGLLAPCADLIGWISLGDEDRYEYVRCLMNQLIGDRDSVLRTFSSVPRSTQSINKRRVRVNTSSARKAEPIKRATEMLRSTFGGDGALSTAKRRSLENAVSTMTNDEERCSIQRGYNLPPESEPKPFTKRPFVDRLDPVKVCRVEQIVSGQLEKDESEQFHNSRFVSSVAKTRRLEKSDLEEMEQKLELTGMGALFDREKFHSMSSKEEKMMRVNAADARSFALGGFKDDQEKFKDIDSRLEKADKLLKNKALSGVNIVSQIKGIPATKKGPPPPTPPKSAKPNVFADVPLRQNVSEAPPRPASMSVVTDSLYSSVNARRRQPCAICSDEVYLAEQLLVEKKIVHKRCFRCFYCEQPLRLGNYGTDRTITEAYGIRFYCSQHMMLSYREKVARIEKHSKRANRASVAIVQPMSPPLARPNVPYRNSVASLPCDETQTSVAASAEKPATFSLHNLNSPDTYKQKTIDRIQALADQPRSWTDGTPERAQYECVRNENSSPNRTVNDGFLIDSDDEEDEDLICDDEHSSSDEMEYGTPLHKGVDSDSSASESEDFADCEEWLQDSLGDHLRNFFERNPNDEVTAHDAEEILNLYNKTLLETMRPSTPEGTKPLDNSVYFTTRSKLENTDSEEEGRIKESDSNYDLLDNTLSGFGARFSQNRPNNTADANSSLLFDSEESTITEPSLALDSTPTRPRRELHALRPRDLAMGMCLHEESSRLTPGAEDSSPSAIPFVDSSPEQTATDSQQVRRPSAGNLLSRLPELMRRRRSQSKGPSSVTVVPVDPDNANVNAKLSELNLNSNRQEVTDEKISAGSTTYISILPENHKCEQADASAADANGAGFKCSICHSLGARMSVPVAKTKTPLSATPKNIQRVRNEMEKYRSNIEQELTLLAQEIQRKISETESRLQDVIVTGSDLEYRLKNNTGNCWTLERWVEYLQEYKMLNLKLEELHIRVKEMHLAREFGEIQRQMDSIRTSSLGVMPVGINETRTRQSASRIISLLDERKAFHEERRNINKKWESLKCHSAAEIAEKGSDFSNFTPVFSELNLKFEA